MAARAADSEPLDAGGRGGRPVAHRPNFPRLLAIPCRPVDRRPGRRRDRFVGPTFGSRWRRRAHLLTDPEPDSSRRRSSSRRRPDSGRAPWRSRRPGPGPSGVEGPRLGAHMSVAGGLPRAVERGVVHGCEAMQIFAKNANQWRGRHVPPDEIRDISTRWSTAAGITPVVSHASYLINLATANRGLRAQSIAAMGDELDRAESLGLLGVVLHPGCYTDGSEAHGLALIAEALDALLRDAPARPDDGDSGAHGGPGHGARRDVRAARDDHRADERWSAGWASASTPAISSRRGTTSRPPTAMRARSRNSGASSASIA